MIDPEKISISDYQYSLPEDRIALFPLSERDDSKLLYWNKGEISDRRFRELPEILEGNMLVFNNTRVIEARILFRTETGAAIEILLLEPELKSDPLIALTAASESRWRCMVGRASKWKNGSLKREAAGIQLVAEKLVQENGTCLIKFSWTPAEKTFAEVIHEFGNIPLPPYLHRNAEKSDTERYQTVYAEKEGSVAAPTAGLHFTADIEKQLDDKGFRREFVTLHVGAGTFKPVTAAFMSEHEMHSELIDVSISFLEKLSLQDPGNTTVVGTTSLRTMESLFWLSAMLEANPEKNLQEVEVHQWLPYQNNLEDKSYTGRIQFLKNWAQSRKLDRLIFHSRLLIMPGYKVRSCGGIITNFHQPSSTLLLLVAAVTEGAWREIYEHALAGDYRFLSYGDSSYLKF